MELVGLAVDWVFEHLYWTDTSYRAVMMSCVSVFQIWSRWAWRWTGCLNICIGRIRHTGPWWCQTWTARGASHWPWMTWVYRGGLLSTHWTCKSPLSHCILISPPTVETRGDYKFALCPSVCMSQCTLEVKVTGLMRQKLEQSIDWYCYNS